MVTVKSYKRQVIGTGEQEWIAEVLINGAAWLTAAGPTGQATEADTLRELALMLAERLEEVRSSATAEEVRTVPLSR